MEMYCLVTSTAMAYSCDLGNGRQVYLENQGNQTVVTSVYQSSGQQQQSSNSFTTGTWSSPPQLYQVPNGMIVKIMTSQGEYCLQIQGGSMSMSSGSMNVGNAQQMSVQEVPSLNAPEIPTMKPMQPMKPLEPMQPMQPMKMGNMQMNMNPMEMRMGNMEMKMGDQPKMKRRFCSQCGSPVKESDRFCSSCGHALD